MGCHFLLQKIFLTQGLNLGLPHCRQMLYHLSHSLSVLFIVSENQLLVLLIFASLFHFFFVCFIYFCSDFYYLFLLLTFGFPFLLFLIALGVKLGCLFDVSLVSWGRVVLLWTTLLALLLLNPIGFGLLCSHFNWFLCIFWLPFWFFPWCVGYSEACYLATICVYF